LLGKINWETALESKGAQEPFAYQRQPLHSTKAIQEVEQIQQTANMDKQGTPHPAQTHTKRKINRKWKQKRVTQVEQRYHPKAGAKTRKGCEVQEGLL